MCLDAGDTRLRDEDADGDGEPEEEVPVPLLDQTYRVGIDVRPLVPDPRCDAEPCKFDR